MTNMSFGSPDTEHANANFVNPTALPKIGPHKTRLERSALAGIPQTKVLRVTIGYPLEVECIVQAIRRRTRECQLPQSHHPTIFGTTPNVVLKGQLLPEFLKLKYSE
jgi:hypothetical protein